ncbi:MAG: soluble lytic murein transglycosylase [Spirochaetes bacterium]|nr:MAG: soluble lytic murein transglycosylase [Spirochaetota bacterium]
MVKRSFLASAATAALLSAFFLFAPAAIPAQEIQIPEFPELAALENGKGAGHWYYVARKIETSGTSADPGFGMDLDFAYYLAFHFGAETEAKESGRALVRRAEAKGDAAGTANLARQWIAYFGADWDIYAALYRSAMAAGDYDYALASLETMAKALPSTAKSKTSELSHYRFSALAAKGITTWTAEASANIDRAAMDSWIAKSLRLASESGALEPAKAALARMRVDFFALRYDAAAAGALEAKEYLRSPGVPRHLISEAGRAFIALSRDPGRTAAGVDFFASFFPETTDGMAAILEKSGRAAGTWVAAFYLARFWAVAGKPTDAAILFLGLTDNAPSPGDADSALWYWLDLTMKAIGSKSFEELGSVRSLELAALSEASGRWKNPAFFDDIVDTYDRNLLKGKFWDDAVALFTLLGARLSPGMATRLLYQSARLVESGRAGLGSAGSGYLSPQEYSQAAYERILGLSSSEEFYKTMAAWRLRREPPFLASMPDLSGDGHEGKATMPSAAAGSGNGAIALFGNYLDYELDDLAASLAARYLGSSDKELVVRLAFELSAAGQHYMALRLARDAVSRGMGERYPQLYGLVYPKAWNDIVARGAAIPDIPEALAYGLIRSESVFDPKAVSYAGAVGLAQLMPATAAETAKGLKMASYSLTNPDMLARFGRKPMRAMFAYNAGPSRMTAWNRESGELPDDILLDAIHLAQPRQYAKNIIQATLAYAKIHYGIDPLAMLDYLVEGTSLPEEPQEPEATEDAVAPIDPMDPLSALRGHGETPE